MSVNLFAAPRRITVFVCLMSLLLACGSALADRYEVGLVAYANGDYEAALQHFKSAAKDGDRGAMHMLMRIYSEHKVNDSDKQQVDRQVMYWATQSAQAGIVQAQYALAELYNHPLATPQELKQAFYWYQQAVNQGHHGAMEKLADLYQQGEAVAQDRKRAQHLYRVAASEYDVFAQKGDPAAQTALANMYENAKGMARDMDRALTWYKKAALQDYAVAQFHLGRLFAKGEHVEKNTQEAVYWLQKAAHQGLAQAQELLAEMERNGQISVAMK